MKPFREDVEYRYYKSDEFLLMVWKPHPLSAKMDFGKIVKILPDYRQVVINAAKFMLDQEAIVLGDFTFIISIPHGFKLRVDFPFLKGKGEEKNLFLKRRIVAVEFLPGEGYHGRGEHRRFAKVLDWNLSEFKCEDQW